MTLLLLLISAPVVANSQFTEASAKYQAGDFKGAAELYEKQVQSGDRTAAVYYDLANAYFRTGQKAKALIAYERALLITPRDPDILWNIAVLKSTLADRLEPKDGNVFMLWIREITAKFTANEVSIAITGILAVWFLWALLSFAFPALKIWLTGIQTVTFLCLAAASILFFFKWQEVRIPRVVVTAKEVTARYGPSERETKAFTLHEGAEGRVMDETGEWINVSLPDKNSGWIPKKFCEKI
jgi:tetratricopeptide (TPR) repeat protein